MARPKSKGETKALNMKINAELFDELDEIATNTYYSKTTIVEAALKEYFENHKENIEKAKNGEGFLL